VVNRSASGPPRAELFELDLAVRVAIDVGERRVDLGVAIPGAQRVQQAAELGFFDRAVAVTVHALEAISQRIQAHARRLRRFRALTNCALLLANFSLASCHSSPELPSGTHERSPANAGVGSRASAEVAEPIPHPTLAANAPPASTSLQALAGSWLEHLSDGEHPVIVMPPLGAVAPSRLIVGVHGAGDRPDWSCGGWRLASQVSAFVVCPQGSHLTEETFAWASEQQLGERVNGAVEVAQARYAPYIDAAPFIYAGFSQGATLAEPFLRRNAARFPIVILAEGGYATARSPAFAKAFYAAGGRRVVLVCGGAACFQAAVGSKKVLENAGLQVLVVGDAKAGHNLNERMQRALQSAWPEITAPLPPR
jgi:predicted esterase